MHKISTFKLILVTPLFILLSHYLSVFPHEYAHSFTAWILGYKINPLDINYGGSSWLNIFSLINIDEKVNYSPIFSSGHGIQAALIAFTGIGIANAPLYVMSLLLLKTNRVKNLPFLYYFLFWFNLLNLCRIYAYVPMRTLATHADVANFSQGLHTSTWWIYIIGGYITAYLIWIFYSHTLISAYNDLKITSISGQVSIMITSVFILFGIFGMIAYSGYGEISHLLSITSVCAIPGIIITLWPTRNWVKQRLLQT